MQDHIKTYLSFVKGICPLLTEAELIKLGSKLSVLVLKKKDFFIRAGDLQKDLGFMVTGLVRSFYIDNAGNEKTMRFLTDRQFVTNYPALLGNQPSKYSYQCLAETTLVKIPYTAIVESYNSSHQFDRFGRIIAEKILQMHQARIESFMFDTAEQRYLAFIAQQPEVFKRISITDLCSYLGVERQTLTRIRNKLSVQR
jgi:CRP/FNR family transcriptional regulator